MHALILLVEAFWAKPLASRVLFDSNTGKMEPLNRAEDVITFYQFVVVDTSIANAFLIQVLAS